VNYYLRAPAKEDVTIAISDASGKVVRQLKGPKTAGLHRVAWDLRDEPYGPSSSGLAGAFVLTNLGPFVLPGEYRVQLTADGKALTKTVKVVGDPLVQMTDADRETLYRTLLALTEMQKTAGSAAEAVTRLDQRLQQIAETLKAYPNAPAAVKTSVAAATKQVTTLRATIAGAGGGRGGGGGGFGGPQPLRNRINSVKSEVVGSQSLPTQVQSSQVAAFRKQLADAIAQVNAVITTTLPNLYKQLNENSIYPSVGEPIKVVQTDGPARLR
jgi:hypothetical protein